MIYVLYHADCRDGFGSAYGAWKSFGDKARYIPCQHGKGTPPIELSAENEAYVLDFSFPRETLLEWHSKLGALTVIDHHVTAREALNDLPFAHFDLSRSASILTWKHFHGDREVPRFLLHVEDMDLWTFRLEGSREVNAAIDSYPQDFETWDGFADDEACERLRREGVSIRRYVERQVEYLCSERHFLEIGSFTGVPAVNSPLFVSEACAKLLELHPDAPLAAAWFQGGDGKRIYSLRSRTGETDVSRLAKSFGGGGHPSASGFSVEAGEPSVS